MPPTLPATLLRWLTLPLLTMVGVMALVGAPLVSPHAPHGIVSLEFCAFTGRCAAIVASWTATQREFALLGLGLDHLYLALYPTVIAAALLVLAGSLSARARALARALSALLACAALADVVENLGLIHLLMTRQVDLLATVAAFCAAFKFAVLLVALACLAAMATMRLRRRLRQA